MNEDRNKRLKKITAEIQKGFNIEDYRYFIDELADECTFYLKKLKNDGICSVDRVFKLLLEHKNNYPLDYLMCYMNDAKRYVGFTEEALFYEWDNLTEKLTYNYDVLYKEGCDYVEALAEDQRFKEIEAELEKENGGKLGDEKTLDEIENKNIPPSKL